MNLKKMIKIIFSLALVCAGSIMPANGGYGGGFGGGYGSGGWAAPDDFTGGGIGGGRGASFPRTAARDPDIAQRLAALVVPIGEDIRAEVATLKADFDRQIKESQAQMRRAEADASAAGRAAKKAAEEAAERAFQEFGARQASLLARLEAEFNRSGSRVTQDFLRDLAAARAALEASARAAREDRERALAAQQQQIAAEAAARAKASADKIAFMQAEKEAEKRLAVEAATAIAEAEQAVRVKGIMETINGTLDALSKSGDSLKDVVEAAGPSAEKMMGTYVEGQKKIEAEKQKHALVMLDAAHKNWTAKTTQVFGLIGDFVTDKKKMGYTALAIGGTYALIKGVQLGHGQAQKYLDTPRIVEATNVPTWFQTIFGRSKHVFPLVKDVMLDKETRDEALDVAVAIRNTKKNGGTFKNYIFWGASGTGKTMMAEAVANECDCYYVMFTGSSFAKLPVKEAIVQLDQLFEWAKVQTKPVMIVVDEAEGLFKQRGADTSETTRQLMTYFMAKTGTPSDKFLVVALTNRPQEFDEAMQTRFPDRIEFKRPGLEQRVAILESDIKRMLQSTKIDVKLLTKAKILEIAEKTKGMCGRDLTYLVTGLRQATYESAGNKLTTALIDKVTERSLKNFAAEQHGFERTDGVAS